MYPDDRDEVVQLYLDDIIPNRFQPREVFDEKALKELAVSIKEHGVIQPIIVRSVNGKYEIIAGERRYKASALAGLTKIPAIVRDLDDKESSKVALLENLQRKNLNPIEEARTYQKILEIDQLTQEELAKTMGKSQSAIANKIRLLSLPEEVQNALLKEQISERHARTLLNLPDSSKQREMLKKIIDNKMSVRALEEEIKGESPNVAVPVREEEEEEPEELFASTNAFVNNNPLVPTAELPEDHSNYGKVTIAPPEGEDSTMGKFINYGEIEKEENEAADMDILNLPPATSTNVDIKSVRNNTSDINKNKGGADLDNLLNLGNPTSSKPTNQFITPAEKIVKMEPLDDRVSHSSDYFKTSDFSSIEVPNSIINPVGNSMFLSQPDPSQNPNSLLSLAMGNTPIPNDNGPYTVEQATAKIKDLITDLTNHGIKVNTDEMNFEKSYQIIIKINKSDE